MARVIEYNPQEVLNKAMDLFWSKGYESTSIQDIVSETGLKPGSLYAAYKNKEGIFQAVIELYMVNSLRIVKDILEADDDILKKIENFLNVVIVDAISNDKYNGCLLVKTLLVVSHKDEKIQQHIVGFYRQLEPLVQNTLQTAKEQAKINIDPREFTKFIFSTIYGTHVYYKSFGDKEIMKKNVDFLLESLKSK